MSWLLKQAEDILNRVDQQTNAAINQHGGRTTRSNQNQDESIPESPSIKPTQRLPTNTRRTKKDDDADLLNFLNSSTPAPVTNKPKRPLQLLNESTRTASVPDMTATDVPKTPEQLSSKSASGTPRSTTPAAQHHDDDEGLVLVRLVNKYLLY